jgi:hypothetical protein
VEFQAAHDATHAPVAAGYGSRQTPDVPPAMRE